MKRVVLFLLMLMTFTVTFSATKVAKPKKVKQPVYKIYEGTYEKATNTFVYKKDNLVFPDKTVKYQLVDQNNSLPRIYDFLGRTYGVTYDDKVEFTVVATVDKGVLYVWQVQNYRIPENKFKR